MKIAVYLGSACGSDPAFSRAAEDLGRWFASRRHTLVFGGSGSGMMKILGDTAYAQGAEVIGVMPRFMIENGTEPASLSELIVTSSMSERRQKMIALSDGFIALPGGPGTLDEISEVMSGMKLRLIRGRAVIWNVGGYYDALRTQMENMTACGFYPTEDASAVTFIEQLQELDPVFAGGDI